MGNASLGKSVPLTDSSKAELEESLGSAVVAEIRDRFESLATHDGESSALSKKAFLKCTCAPAETKPEVLEKLFTALNWSGSGFLSFDEFLQAVHVLRRASDQERLACKCCALCTVLSC
jgi:Ca2+-binding EF-hand superfamily protein